MLTVHVPNYIDIWWLVEMNHQFNPQFICEQFPHKIDVWFNVNWFNWRDGSWALCQFCHNSFHVWWDGMAFNLEHQEYLEIYCSEYEKIWKKDILIRKLIQGTEGRL